jgi:hypothetical protein
MVMRIRRTDFTRWAQMVFAMILCIAFFKTDPGAATMPPGLRADLDRDTARIGSIVLLTLGYDLPEGARFPGSIEIGGLEKLTITGRQVKRHKIMVKLLVDQQGFLETGTISIPYLDAKGETRRLVADPVSLTVLSNLGDNPEEAVLKPFQDIMPDIPFYMKMPYWVCMVVCLGIFYGGYIAIRRYRPEKTITEVVDPPIPPHILAQQKLDDLMAKKLFESGKTKTFYFEFSAIMRHYLEDLRGFPAAEYTIQEIALHIRQKEDQGLLELLRHADQVKFADIIPTHEQTMAHIQTAMAYVRKTTPAPMAVASP